jgi:acyl-lipid omega-6 desaturase (Delta-12 desaturase)
MLAKEESAPSTEATPEATTRSGPELIRASNAFADEDLAKTWFLFAQTLFLWSVCVVIACTPTYWFVQLFGGMLAGLTIVRMFIFYHDYLHGAIFRKDPFGRFAMLCVGMYTLNPPSVWKETHDYHHKNNAKMLGAAIGSYPVVTTRIWRHMKPTQRRWYAFARHPLTMLFGYFTIFIGGMCIAAFLRAPKVHWQGPVALLLHVAAFAGVGLQVGWLSAFCAVILPVAFTHVLGGYLFYVQHNFPDVKMKDRREWNYHYAALNSSSMFDMSPIMHWFTGNIGYHHVHHLNHRIPFYRLPDAMAAIPELQTPGRTSWSIHDIRAALQLKIWDPAEGKLVGWDALSRT